jgi:hypothetical protein
MIDYKKTIKLCCKAYIYLTVLCALQFFMAICINYYLGLRFTDKANELLIMGFNHWTSGIVAVILLVPVIAIIKPSLLFPE